MSRWTDMDSDLERLPAGFKRIGYDADDETYTFSGPDGKIYESEPGCRYGKLWPVGEPRHRRSDSGSVPGMSPSTSIPRKDNYTSDDPDPRKVVYTFDDMDVDKEAIKKDNREAARMMLPFALLVFVFLILFFKLVDRPASDHGSRQVIDCAQGSHQVQIRQGDTCWAIGETYSLSVDELLSMPGNEVVNCDKLRLGQAVCVPESL